MENKNLLLKGRTSIYAYVIIGCLGMPTLFYLVSNLIWSVLGFLPNIYFHILQIIISGLIIYYSLGAIYSYEIYEDCIIKKHYTKIRNNLVNYDKITIDKVQIGGFNQVILIIHFRYIDTNCREAIEIESKAKAKKLIEYCRQNHIPYDDTPIFGGRYD